MSHVEIYQEMSVNINGVGSPLEDFYKPRKWRWRFRAANGRILADGGQGYVRRIDCLNGCAQVLGGWIERGYIHRNWDSELQEGDHIEIRDLTK